MEQQSEGTAPESLNTQAAAQVFESLLTKSEEEAPEGEPAVSNEPEQVTEPETEEPEQEESAEEDSQEQTESEPVQTVKVTVNGEEVEVPLDEALKGYQRTADYTRKTQQLAEERKAAEGVRQRAEAQLGQYEQAINQALTIAQQFAPAEPNWDALYQDDPLEFVRQREAWRDRGEKLARLQSEQQRIQQERQHQNATALQQHLEQESRLLTEAIPEWKDEAKAKADRTALLEYGKSVGYTAEELSKVYDHRVVKMMRDAMNYRALMEKKTLTENKVRQAPKMVKPGASAPPPSKLDDSMRRLQKTGKQADAARAFFNIL